MTSLYIHIPFCKSKCFYCSFAVSIGQEERIDLYLDCLKHEMKSFQQTKIKSLYFGGGTPSLIDGKQWAKLFKDVHQKFLWDNNTECTVEMNPENLSKDKLMLLKDHGVNRISLGVQSFHNEYLKYLGRNHDREAAFKAFDVIRQCRVDNVNIDLMIAFPQQTKKELMEDLNQLIQLDSEHVSLYSLTVEEQSKFFTKDVKIKNDERCADFYQSVCERLKGAGFEQYEVSNFCKKGQYSTHNLHYWEGGNYIGLGMGAHSHNDGYRKWNVSNLFKYIQFLQKGQSPVESSETLSPEQRFFEAVLIGLRMNKGIRINGLLARYEIKKDTNFIDQVQRLKSEQYLIEEDDILRATDKGRLVLDELSAQLCKAYL